MRSIEDKTYYKRNFKLSIIVSLIITIAFFLFFPEIKVVKKEIPFFPEPVITLIDIPITKLSLSPAAPKPASPVVSLLFIPSDEPEVSPVNNESSLPTEPGINGDGQSKRDSENGAYEASSFPFVPRQILEVFPKQVTGHSGFVKLRVLIGVDGYVRQQIIIDKSTDSEEMITNVTEAVSKSRWQPVTIEGEKVEYWIEKTYTFN